MDKNPPQTRQIKAFQANLDEKKSPKKRAQIEARLLAAELIERVRQQSRLRK